jgi:hypothetical protein
VLCSTRKMITGQFCQRAAESGNEDIGGKWGLLKEYDGPAIRDRWREGPGFHWFTLAVRKCWIIVIEDVILLLGGS